MKLADGIILLIIAGIVAGVVRMMKKQKEEGGGCHSGCSGCSKAKNCSSRR